MVQLTCNCLNVKINLKETDLNANHPEIPSDCEECDFFHSDLVEVKIPQSAVRQEHSYLVHKVEVKDWLVHRCINCGVYTHAVPSSPSRRGLLVSMSLQSESATHERMTRSSDFSAVFQVVLRNQDANLPTSFPISEEASDAFQSLQVYISNIQHQLNSYLLQEESNMEERIRVFEEEQRAMFSELKTRVKNDKKKMISVLFNNLETSSEETSTALNGNRPTLRSSKSVPMTTAVNVRPPHKGHDRRSDNIPTRPRSFRSYEESPDNDAMFMLDDEEEDIPFSSVSDEEDTDDSLQMDDSRRSSSGGNLNNVFSTSVPISVPVWKNRSPRKEEFDEDRVQAPAMDQMAASMKALAKSVHNNDATDIFGELPRPRLNTFTGTLTRPARK